MSGVGIAGAYRRASPSADNLSAEEIFGRAERGETLASAIVEKGMDYLLPAIANLLTFADPELLVIGGGVAGSLVRHAARIEAYVARMTPFPPRIAWSQLKGRAGLVGAIRLAVLESLGAP
jgi:glucokinase